MKKRLIKIMGIVLSLIIIALTVTAIVYAVDDNRIGAEIGPVKSGEVVEVPVCISNNTGFMGMSLLFLYDESVMEPVSTAKGDIIESGLFDDSIATSLSNEFKVIWCGTNEITADGEICVLNFKINESACDGTYKISVSYDDKNTFNEKYEAVDFSCENIIISVENEEPDTNEDSDVNKELTVWQKIINFFADIWVWFIGLFI